MAVMLGGFIFSGLSRESRMRVQVLLGYRRHTASEAVEGTYQEDQSVASLAGTYADAPFMQDFPQFLEEYRRKINSLNEE